MKRIELGVSNGRPVYIDIETLIATRMLVTASSGGGKSETIRGLLEQAVGQCQCIVLDPEGEFSTLREKYPFVLVGEGGETAADIRTAALVATRLLELNASAVCDLYEMKVADRHEWVKRFVNALVQAPKELWHPVLVFIDEAHTYAPERGYAESVATSAIVDLANLGRKRGFCLIAATQRLSKLSKNVTEPLQNYLVGRTTFDDQTRAAATFKIAPGAATREFSLELERLKDGEFICRGRALSDDMLKVQVTRGVTRPPKTGTAMAGIVTPTPAAIKALLPKLADLPQEAEKKAKTEEDLRRELSTAMATIKRLESAGGDPQEVKVLKETIAQLQTEADELEQATKLVNDKLAKAAEIAKSLYEILSNSQLVLLKSIASAPPVIKALAPIPAPVVRSAPPKADAGVNGPQVRILNAAATFAAANVPPRIEYIANLCGTTKRARGFEENIRQLRSQELIRVTDGLIYDTSGMGIAETMDSGMSALRAVLSEPQARLLQKIKEFPGSTAEDLALAMGTTERSRGFEENLRRLRADSLVEGSKTSLRVAEWLR